MKHPQDAKAMVIAGLLSAGTFFAVLAMGLGSFFLFLPTLPLFYVGLSTGERNALAGGFIATGIIVIIGKFAASVLFLLAIALPACYFIHASLMSRTGPDGSRQWRPIGHIMVNLAVTASAFLALITFAQAFQPQNLPQLLEVYVRTALEPLKADFGPAIEDLAVNWLFLPLAVTFWIWGIGIYVHAWLAVRLLSGKKLSIRPDVAVSVFTIPSWMLTLLGICALASLIGGQSSQFLGKTLIIVLAMPYFFLGLSLLHRASALWPNRKFFLTIIYILIALLFWPAAFFSVAGLVYQVKHLNKGLPA